MDNQPGGLDKHNLYQRSFSSFYLVGRMGDFVRFPKGIIRIGELVVHERDAEKLGRKRCVIIHMKLFEDLLTIFEDFVE